MNFISPKKPLSSETTYTQDELTTEVLGLQLGQQLNGGSIVALYGDLGSGKTVFARGIAKGMGIDDPVTSPTFNLVQEYQGEKWKLYHIDLYRIEDENDALAFGIDHFLTKRNAINVIEWPERIQKIIDDTFYEVYIVCEDLTKRKVTINRMKSGHQTEPA